MQTLTVDLRRQHATKSYFPSLQSLGHVMLWSQEIVTADNLAAFRK